MRQYLDMLEMLLEEGTETEDRTGVGTWYRFGYQMRLDLKDGFPLLTTKRLFWKGIVYELLWFLRGGTNLNLAYLHEHNVHIWDEWADEEGSLGPIYGSQWRNWQSPGGSFIDQIKWVINEIKQNPTSRRLIVTAWNPADTELMALPPCPTLFQFDVTPQGELSCQLYQRSADVFLGVPFNIASYSLLTLMVAHVCDLKPGEFVHTFGNLHLYKNHREQALEQLSRDPRPLPQLTLNPEVTSIDGFTRMEDFELSGYSKDDVYPHIEAEVAV